MCLYVASRHVRYRACVLPAQQNVNNMLGSLGMSAGPDPTVEPDPIAGLGFGLPLARCYAEYLGGSLRALSMPGLGFDMVLQLHRGEGCVENTKTFGQTLQ